MKTNRLTPTETEMIFGFTRAEFDALERAEISDERGDELAAYFCDGECARDIASMNEEYQETWNKYVEECGGL
jgi:hypothetical protein